MLVGVTVTSVMVGLTSQSVVLATTAGSNIMTIGTCWLGLISATIIDAQ
jgi:hypothetical protein